MQRMKAWERMNCEWVGGKQAISDAYGTIRRTTCTLVSVKRTCMDGAGDTGCEQPRHPAKAKPVKKTRTI